MLEFWRVEESKVDYLQLHLMFKVIVHNVPEAAAEFARMPKIDQDPTHELWFHHGDEPFDETVAREAVSGAFFQKTERLPGAVVPGSFKDCLINGNFAP